MWILAGHLYGVGLIVPDGGCHAKTLNWVGILLIGCVFTSTIVSLNISEGVLFTDFVKRLKNDWCFTSKIVFHLSNLRRARARIN